MLSSVMEEWSIEEQKKSCIFLIQISRFMCLIRKKRYFNGAAQKLIKRALIAQSMLLITL